jgi:hypothetical protein
MSEAVEALAECWKQFDDFAVKQDGLRHHTSYKRSAEKLSKRLAALGWELRKKEQER